MVYSNGLRPIIMEELQTSMMSLISKRTNYYWMLPNNTRRKLHAIWSRSSGHGRSVAGEAADRWH
jgi:hypothetical protein